MESIIIPTSGVLIAVRPYISTGDYAIFNFTSVLSSISIDDEVTNLFIILFVTTFLTNEYGLANLISYRNEVTIFIDGQNRYRLKFFVDMGESTGSTCTIIGIVSLLRWIILIPTLMHRLRKKAFT